MNREEQTTKAAEEMESDVRGREEGAHERDVMLQKEVNQEVQTGTNDATHPGIKWGSSYQTKRKSGTRKKSARDAESKR